MRRYRLTFVPWSWPPFIKSSTDTPAGSTSPPPPSTQNRPRLNRDSFLIHFFKIHAHLFCAPESTTLLSYYQRFFTPPQIWDHLCFPLVVDCSIDTSPTHPSTLWISTSQRRLLSWSSLERECFQQSACAMETIGIQSAPQTNRLQLRKTDPADLITSWLHFSNSALMTYMCYLMQNR